MASGGFSPTGRLLRTAKSCGPGAATLASIRACLCGLGNGGKRGRSPGRSRISRKAVARGRPGCPGCTCETRVRFPLPIAHGDCGCRRRPVFPAPSVHRRANEMTELRAHHGRGAFRLGLKLRKAACGSRQLLCLGYFAWGCFRYFGLGGGARRQSAFAPSGFGATAFARFASNSWQGPAKP